jgi:rhamnose transport system permease protein
MEPEALALAADTDQLAVGASAEAPDRGPEPPGPPTVARRPHERARSMLRWETGLVVALIATVVLGVSLSSQFLSSYNLFNLGLSNGEVAIMTLPMMLIIVAGEIDLSIQSTLALASSLVGYLWEHGWPMPLIIVTVLLVGVLLGLFNGLLVTRLGLPSLAVTIGTLTLYAGIAEIVLGSTIVSNFPAGYTNIGVYAFPHTDLSYSAVIFVVLAVIFGVVLHATPFGRTVFAVGANADAARYAGIRVKRVKTTLFAVSGLIGALAGILFTFRLDTAEFDNGAGLVLSVVAIVLLGGVSIFGGRGSIVGVVLAVLVFAGIQNALLLTSFPEQAIGIVTGGLLLVSILVPNAGLLLQRGRGFVDRRQLKNNS